jgi:hypothetical protein
MTDARVPPTAPSRPLALRFTKSIPAVVAFIASVLGIVFLLWPSLKPEAQSPTRHVELSEPTLERSVTFGAYLKRINQPPGGLEDAVLKERGALASFDFVIEGYKDRPLPLTWQLIDTRSGEVLDENRDIRLEAEVTKDSGTWHVWVPLPKGERKRVFIMIELFQPGGVIALETLRTRTFPVK